MNPSWDPEHPPSVCLVHDWLVAMRGGEKVLEAISELFPDAPIYTLFYNQSALAPNLRKRTLYASFLQNIPGIHFFYRWLLFLFPIAIRSLNVKNYDLVISSSHCVAKGVRVRPGATHVCYCHAPMRYLWGFSDEYLGRFPKTVRLAIERYFRWLKKWDAETASGVQLFIANSRHTAAKIQHCYGRPSVVIHPPVDFGRQSTEPGRIKGDYFLIVSALVPYKRIDLAIEAFNQLKRPLEIVGDGPSKRSLERMVRFEGIQFDGWLDQEALWDRYANARALIFPGEEDFGIVPLEAQGFGLPVIAFGNGGIRDSVLAVNEAGGPRPVDESTGIFFYDATPESLVQAVLAFERLTFQPAFIREHARTFGHERFQKELMQVLRGEGVWAPSRAVDMPVGSR